LDNSGVGEGVGPAGAAVVVAAVVAAPAALVVAPAAALVEELEAVEATGPAALGVAVALSPHALKNVATSKLTTTRHTTLEGPLKRSHFCIVIYSLQCEIF